MVKSSFFCFLIFILCSNEVYAQEFNCEVSINDEQISNASFNYKDEIQNRIRDYLNEFRWTEVTFLEEERIKCSIQIFLESTNSNFDFSGRIVFNARRPIYNTISETNTLILSDNLLQFNYPQGKSLIHDELQFDDLTAVLDYYAYLILGFDFDSFSELGGTNYFLKAQRVVDIAQSSNSLGWTRTANNRRNRSTLIADLINQNYEPLRQAYYMYHRRGLDVFLANNDRAYDNMIEALTLIRDNKRRSTSNYVYDVFFDTKSKEIASFFGEAPQNIRLDAYNILSETDQGHLSDYSRLQN